MSWSPAAVRPPRTHRMDAFRFSGPRLVLPASRSALDFSRSRTLKTTALIGKTCRTARSNQRTGSRHGTRERTLTTSLGPTTIEMPRARVRQADGSTAEWRSQTVRRYQRRTTRVDEAILGVYLAGGTRAGSKARGRRCCGAARSRRMRCRVWSGGCARTSTPGGPAIWRTRISATCCWTAGIRRSASAGAASACRCW
jgi:hypothetical protein